MFSFSLFRTPPPSLCLGLTPFSLHPHILTKCSLLPSSQCVQPRPSFSPRCTQTRLSPSQLTVVCISTEMLCYCVQLVCKVFHTFNHTGTRGFVLICFGHCNIMLLVLIHALDSYLFSKLKTLGVFFFVVIHCFLFLTHISHCSSNRDLSCGGWLQHTQKKITAVGGSTFLRHPKLNTQSKLV